MDSIVVVTLNSTVPLRWLPIAAEIVESLGLAHTQKVLWKSPLYQNVVGGQTWLMVNNGGFTRSPRSLGVQPTQRVRHMHFLDACVQIRQVFSRQINDEMRSGIYCKLKADYGTAGRCGILYRDVGRRS